jgi:hypothetical protein
VIGPSLFGAARETTPRSTDSGDPSVVIAMLSWAWAVVAVDVPPARCDEWTVSRWLAAHPSDANLAARLAVQPS